MERAIGPQLLDCVSIPTRMVTLIQRRPMDLACHHLETIRQERTTRETSQVVERRPGQILERHDLAEDSTRQANLEAAC